MAVAAINSLYYTVVLRYAKRYCVPRPTTAQHFGRISVSTFEITKLQKTARKDSANRNKKQKPTSAMAFVAINRYPLLTVRYATGLCVSINQSAVFWASFNAYSYVEVEIVSFCKAHKKNDKNKNKDKKCLGTGKPPSRNSKITTSPLAKSDILTTNPQVSADCLLSQQVNGNKYASPRTRLRARDRKMVFQHDASWTMGGIYRWWMTDDNNCTRFETKTKQKTNSRASIQELVQAPVA